MMRKDQTTQCCKRHPHPKEIMREDAQFDLPEDTILTMARFFFQTYAIPEQQTWMSGYDLAEAAFGPDLGPVVGSRLFGALRAVRMSRRSVFCFNSPTCPTCEAVVTEHERRFMGALQGLRHGQPGRTQMELMMLCEGNDVTNAIIALDRLVTILPPLDRTRQEAPHVQYTS